MTMEKITKYTKQIVAVLLLASASMLVISLVLWNQQRYLRDDSQVFWDSISNSLNTTGYRVYQSDSQDFGSASQRYHQSQDVSFLGGLSVRTQSDLKLTTDEVQRVGLEWAATKDREFVRYTELQLGGGKDTSQAVNKWAEIKNQNSVSSHLSELLFNQAVLFGFVQNQAERQMIIDDLKSAYFEVKRVPSADPDIYQYNVQIDFVAFSSAAAKYMRALGYGSLAEQIEAAGQTNTIQATIGVNPKTLNVESVQTGAGLLRYTAHGVSNYWLDEPPQEDITASELEVLINQISR